MTAHSRSTFLPDAGCGLILCLTLAVFPAWAEESASVLVPLVVSGNYIPSSAFDLPYSVDTVSQPKISDGQLGVNLSEVLQRVPGLVVQNRQNYAQDLQISSRGFGSRAAFGIRGLKLFTDGIPASTPDGQGQAATFNLDVADRIEVLRGPAATLYGSNSGGVIQMFSRDGQGTPRIGAGTTFGSDGFRRHHLNAEGGIADQAGFIVDASRMDTDGYRDHSATRRDQTFAKLNLKPDEHSRLALIYSSLEQNGTKDPQGQSWDAYRNDPRSVSANTRRYNTRKSLDHQQLGMNYERYVGNATLQINLYTGERKVIQYQSIPREVQLKEPRHRGGVIDFERKFHGGTVRWLQPVERLPGNFRVAAGIDYDYSRDDRQGYFNFQGEQLGIKGDLRRDEYNTSTSIAPYLQGIWDLGSWTFQAGLRYNEVKMDVDDHYLSDGDDSGSKRYRKSTPSVSVMYAFTPDLRGYITAARGFETPTMGEMAYSPDTASGAFNLGLKPSTSTQLEAGIKARLAPGTLINAAVFQIRTDNEIVVAGSEGGRTQYQNAGSTLRRGLELSIDSQLSEQWRASLAYTYLSANYDEAFTSKGETIDKGKHLPGVPRTTLFGELVWQPIPGISTGLEGQYRSKLYVNDSNQDKAAPSYAVFNWRIHFEQDAGPWTFHQLLRVDNLLDRRYVGSIIVGDGNRRYYEAAPGISWFAGAGLEYRF